MNNYFDVCKKLSKLIRENEQQITECLTKIEPLKMVKDEICRSLWLLKNIKQQDEYLRSRLNKSMSVYLPLNQPLYSLLLNVVIPALVLKKVYYRPPLAQVELHKELKKLVLLPFDNIVMCEKTRKNYFNENVLNSDMVNFTGKYENATDLLKQLPKEIKMIYNGSSINPVVVGKDANVVETTREVIEARLYNSGQDCMAPAAIFVDDLIADEFLNELKKELSKITVGDNFNQKTDVGPLLEKESLQEYLDTKESNPKNLYLESKYDLEKITMTPAIFYFEKPVDNVKQPYFAPYFFIMRYSSLCEVREYLDQPYCELYAGYISIYGKSLYCETWHSGKNSLIPLYNTTLFYDEDGNKEFGGYGEGCSFVSYNGKIHSRPILLAKEIKGE